jgi:hypothetical protein
MIFDVFHIEKLLLARVSSETSFVSYFAKHETKQVSCFAQQTCCFAKFRYEAKQAVLHFSLFFKRNETVRFACFVTIFFFLSNFVFHKENHRCRIGPPNYPVNNLKFKGIVERDFVVRFFMSFERSEVPKHKERVHLLLIFRFRVEFFDFRVSA